MALPAFLTPVTAVNMALLVLYPIAWFAPLARAGILPFFSGNEITVYGGVQDLWASDAALAILVALFAVVIPYGKTLFLSAIHFGLAGGRALGLIEPLGEAERDAIVDEAVRVFVAAYGASRTTP